MSDQILNSIKRVIINTIRPYRKEVEKKYILERDFQFKPLSEIMHYQNMLFIKLLIHAYKTPYYKKIIDNFGKPIEKFSLDDLKYFPILTKEIIRAYTQDLINKTAKGICKNSSGGSTGKPIQFYQDYNYIIHNYANIRICNGMAGYIPESKIAKLWGAPQDIKKSLGFKNKLKFWLFNTRFYDSYDMGYNKMLLYNKNLMNFKSDIIEAYTSSLFLFAKFLEKERIDPDYPTLSIITSAEKLHQHMRQKIETVFGIKIFDRYGSRETGPVSAECEFHNGQHIMMTDFIVEVVDPLTEKFIYDKPGEIIITVLNNFAMPFIRYKIGDMGVISKEPCSCGRTTYRLKEIIGRTYDNFLMPDGKIIYGAFFAKIIYPLENIKAFQFIQEDLRTFILKLVLESKYQGETVEKIKDKITKVIGKKSKLIIILVDEIEKLPSGKYQFTISKVDKI